MINRYPELERALNVMKAQDELFKPSIFWHEAALAIVDEVNNHGIENFRRLPLALSFFVPSYGTPGNSFPRELIAEITVVIKSFMDGENTKPELIMEQFLNGYLLALADYRVLVGADDKDKLPALHNFSESQVGAPIEQFKFDKRYYSRSSLNYLLGLVMLKKHLLPDELKTVVEIGGGFGTLGEILSQAGIAGLKYIDLDIPPTSFIAQYYLSEIVGSENVTTFAQTAGFPRILISSLNNISVLCNWQLEKLEGEVDLFVNFISFQEMEPAIVKNYLNHILRLKTKWVLLRNMREGKQIRADGQTGVEVPIQTNDYLRMLPNYKLIEKNIVPFGFKTADGYHSELLLLKRNEL
ncbi:hypothetical protein A9Q82_03655 [Cycloclasticus sp. 46_120_T64]|nr:hypothetical protein A9Q82_03655 [Cycloclasticus sp. 46_120_T64]